MSQLLQIIIHENYMKTFTFVFPRAQLSRPAFSKMVAQVSGLTGGSSLDL